MTKIYPLNELEIPLNISQVSGPYEEFKQDVSIVSVKLISGELFDRVMLLYPNYVIAVAECEVLPFCPSDVIEVFQKPSKYRKHSDSNWVYWYDPNQVI